jgi:hypothetical protein
VNRWIDVVVVTARQRSLVGAVDASAKQMLVSRDLSVVNEEATDAGWVPGGGIDERSIERA